jgi:hypothetical protein
VRAAAPRQDRASNSGCRFRPRPASAAKRPLCQRWRTVAPRWCGCRVTTRPGNAVDRVRAVAAPCHPGQSRSPQAPRPAQCPGDTVQHTVPAPRCRVACSHASLLCSTSASRCRHRGAALRARRRHPGATPRHHGAGITVPGANGRRHRGALNARGRRAERGAAPRRTIRSGATGKVPAPPVAQCPGTPCGTRCRGACRCDGTEYGGASRPAKPHHPLASRSGHMTLASRCASPRTPQCGSGAAATRRCDATCWRVTARRGAALQQPALHGPLRGARSCHIAASVVAMSPRRYGDGTRSCSGALPKTAASLDFSATQCGGFRYERAVSRQSGRRVVAVIPWPAVHHAWPMDTTGTSARQQRATRRRGTREAGSRNAAPWRASARGAVVGPPPYSPPSIGPSDGRPDHGALAGRIVAGTLVDSVGTVCSSMSWGHRAAQSAGTAVPAVGITVPASRCQVPCSRVAPRCRTWHHSSDTAVRGNGPPATPCCAPRPRTTCGRQCPAARNDPVRRDGRCSGTVSSSMSRGHRAAHGALARIAATEQSAAMLTPRTRRREPAAGATMRTAAKRRHDAAGHVVGSAERHDVAPTLHKVGGRFGHVADEAIPRSCSTRRIGLSASCAPQRAVIGLAHVPTPVHIVDDSTAMRRELLLHHRGQRIPRRVALTVPAIGIDSRSHVCAAVLHNVRIDTGCGPRYECGET